MRNASKEAGLALRKAGHPQSALLVERAWVKEAVRILRLVWGRPKKIRPEPVPEPEPEPEPMPCIKHKHKHKHKK